MFWTASGKHYLLQALFAEPGLAAGGAHTCARTEQGGASCWGNNWSGQLGDGTTIDRLAPVEVIGPAGGVASLAASTSRTCALADQGGLLCWGQN